MHARVTPQRTYGVAALNLRACLHPANDPRVTPVEEVLSPSFRTHVTEFGSAAATKCVSRRDDGPLFKWKKNALLAGKRPGHTNSLNRTGGAAALVLRARLDPKRIHGYRALGMSYLLALERI